jgi:purine-nucleoside/S-methyl-5'-thioadenosine phosphorylase / adenosine deaminase
MLVPIEAHCLTELPGIRHGFFTRAGGASQGIYAGLNCGPGSKDDPAHVADNRARVAQYLRAQHPDVVTLYQVHSAVAVAVSEPVAAADRPKADAVVTRTPGLAVGALTADCAPVLFADPEARVVAAAHAGWRGATGGVLEATLAQMEAMGAQRRHIRAAVGPAINQVSYEVGPEFEAALVKSCASNAQYFSRAGATGRPHFDLPEYVEDRLKAAQLAHVERQSPCTYANESLFFSYRRSQHLDEADYGRQIAAIVVT